MFEGSYVVILCVAMATVKCDGLFFSRSEQTMQMVKSIGDVSKDIEKLGIILVKYWDYNVALNLLNKYS